MQLYSALGAAAGVQSPLDGSMSQRSGSSVASSVFGTPLRPLDLGLCVLFLFFFTPLFAIVGTGSTLVQIRESWISGIDDGR